jgi:hypothetical protein
MKAHWSVPRTTLRPHSDSLWLSIRPEGPNASLGASGWLWFAVCRAADASESRFRSGIKHLGASLPKAIVAAVLKALQTKRWME